MPRTFQEKYPIEMRNLRLNSRKLTTPFDIHETLKHFLDFDTSKRFVSGKLNNFPRGISLFKNIPTNRTCNDAQIEAHWCSCLNWIELNVNATTGNLNEETLKVKGLETTKNDNLTLNKDYSNIKKNLKYYSKSALNIANKAVDFINSLIDKDFEIYCHKIYLHSIQKLSKLDVNSKLMAFKESKDIHGREALFLNINENSSQTMPDNGNLDVYINKRLYHSFSKSNLSVTKSSGTNASAFSSSSVPHEVSNEVSNLDSETVFQISLTTWPGNATYELSFRYNRYKQDFKFNKNEISRINSYNGTSNCMNEKRPDLRQFCYCY